MGDHGPFWRDILLATGNYTWTDCLDPVNGSYVHTSTLDPDDPALRPVSLTGNWVNRPFPGWAVIWEWGSFLDPPI